MAIQSNLTRRTVLAGGAALALAGVGIGVAAAQQIKAPTGGDRFEAGERFEIRLDEGKMKEQHDRFMATLTGKLGVSRDKLEAAIADASRESGLPGGFPGLPLAGPPMGTVARFGYVFALGPDDAAARALGLTPEQLKAERKAGRSLTEVARARNVDPTVVADAIKADLEAHFERAKPDPAKMVASMMNAKPGDGITMTPADEVDYVVKRTP